MRISLLYKIMGAFLLLILISALVISISTLSGTRHAFSQYSSNNRNQWSLRLSEKLADFYSASSSWNGVDQFLSAELVNDSHPSGFMGRGKNESVDKDHTIRINGTMDGYDLRLVLSDKEGKVVFDSQNLLTGQPMSKEVTGTAYPVTVSSQEVGSLLVSYGDIVTGSPAANFLESVRRSILFSVIAGVLIAIILGAILFNQFTSPLRQLKKAAHAVGEGDFHQRVNIQSHDEFAEVGKSFNQMAESLENAEISRQHYMADIAHELRTPLTAIQGTVEAMQDNILPLDEEQLAVLHAQTTLLNRLVDDLRLLTLAETGQLKLMLSSVNPGVIIKQTVDSLKPMTTPKNISLVLEIDPEIQEWQLDSHRFIQILNNLLSNAIRYTPENGAISVFLNRTNSGDLELRVRDTGIGIPPDDLPHIFDRFYRADKSRARISGGAGLGLSIVKHLVEAHGGEITVTSPLNQDKNENLMGTEFCVIFPVTTINDL